MKLLLFMISALGQETQELITMSFFENGFENTTKMTALPDGLAGELLNELNGGGGSGLKILNSMRGNETALPAGFPELNQIFSPLPGNEFCSTPDLLLKSQFPDLLSSLSSPWQNTGTASIDGILGSNRLYDGLSGGRNSFDKIFNSYSQIFDNKPTDNTGTKTLPAMDSAISKDPLGGVLGSIGGESNGLGGMLGSLLGDGLGSITKLIGSLAPLLEEIIPLIAKLAPLALMII